ncbi:sporulation protein YpjB [Bacillus benzoevorans]|uniref:Sporulation protein YpjB n=1 Tax=Bacillus benzoevorans TaxID=1456 RepID=A0A7X0LUQ2_9BACI|nr:sporulation protein YpjB [Bacillus benzoevorans]MBB6444685.1 sporulation protein YpjB [Bacillus benzoevorans]
MRFTIWIAALICLLFIPLPIVAAQDLSPIDQLSHMSDEALQLTKSQRYEDAKKILDSFSDKFSTAALREQSFTMDEVRIVTIAHNEAVEAMTNSEMNFDERINIVTKFRLVIDAISSTKEPLWTEMREPILEVFNEAKEAALNGEKTVFYAKLNSFLSLYEMIYPSMKIDVPVERIQKLNTRVRFVDEYRSEILTEQTSVQELFALETDLQTIFDGVLEDEADPSLWWVIISTGSIIVLTLSYVGWRKFKGERERRKTPSR